MSKSILIDIQKKKHDSGYQMLSVKGDEQYSEKADVVSIKIGNDEIRLDVYKKHIHIWCNEGNFKVTPICKGSDVCFIYEGGIK